MVSFNVGADANSDKVFILRNGKGLEARFIEYGAAIQSLIVTDRNGERVDVALGYGTAEEYQGRGRDCFGAICGRVAGRLAGGRFELDGVEYNLEKNDRGNHLHGGLLGLDRKKWDGQIEKKKGNPCVAMRYNSPDGEEGYPGNLLIKVVYSMTDEAGLVIEYEAETDKTTPVCMTNHSYFNLDGNGDISEMAINIDSDEITEVGKDMRPLGRKRPVDGLPDDLRESKRIGDFLQDLYKQHGSMYVTKVDRSFGKVATLASLVNGVQMQVWTDQPYIQFYTGEHLNVEYGKKGKTYHRFSGLCLECQGYPSAPVYPEMGPIYLKPGEIYKQKTEYRFLNLGVT